MSGLSEDQIFEIQETFSLFETRGNGKVEVSCWKVGLMLINVTGRSSVIWIAVPVDPLMLFIIVEKPMTYDST